MEEEAKANTRRWIEDAVTIALLGAVFYFVEVLALHAFQQWLGYVPPWEAKRKFIVFAVILGSSLGVLLGVLSALLIHSNRYLVVACPAALVAVVHLIQFPKMDAVDPGAWVDAVRYVFGLGTLYLVVAILVAVAITFAKQRRDFSRVRLAIIRIGIPALALGVGCYVGWGFGRASIAAPDLVVNTRINLGLLSLLEDQEDDRARELLESALDNYALAMPVWRKAVLRPHIRKQMDDALVRIARYRQKHPKNTDYDVGHEEYEQQWLKGWREIDQRLEAIYRSALESASEQESDQE